MKPKLLIVTGNSMKFRELSNKLGEFFDCEQKILKEPEIQGTPEEIVRHKITRAYQVFKQPVLVDDVSFHFDELGGFPGPYMRDFFYLMTPQAIGIKFAGSRAKAVCRLGLTLREEDIIIAKGEVAGKIIAPKHNNHMGAEFDLFLIADGMDKPMIEYPVEEKNEFSHRGMAMKNLLEILKKETHGD